MNRARPIPLRASAGRPRSWYKGNRVSSVGDVRIIAIGGSPGTQGRANNKMVTSKYTTWSFLPVNLYEQFRRVANFYFLSTSIIIVCIDSPISPWTSFLPLLFVVSVTAIKQGYEDFQRHRTDNEVNKLLVNIIRNGVPQKLESQYIRPGDLVRVECDADVPCDLVLMASSLANGRCYVTTANLDGESNLKTLQLPPPLRYVRKPEQLMSVQGRVECEHPHPDLYRFHGRLELTGSVCAEPPPPAESPRTSINSISARFGQDPDSSEEEQLSAPLSTDHLLLKGSRLRNTGFVYGCAVYTGQNTKIALNSLITRNKFSSIEKSINKFLVCGMSLLVIISLTSTIAKYTVDIHGGNVDWNPRLNDDGPTFHSFINDLFNFLVLYNYLVPISLYVTIEMQKFLGAFFFMWDNQMYSVDSNRPAVCNTTDLNEELGLVEYLFADKTGTLTENEMVFRRCSINGSAYCEQSGNLYVLPESGDSRHGVLAEEFTPAMEHFFLALSLCHTAQMDYDESYDNVDGVHFSYSAASPDERALLLASARLGIVFLGEAGGFYVVRVRGIVRAYRRLEVLEFTSDRKRMSVVVRDPAGDIWLFCKGAEVAVLPLVTQGQKALTIAHIQDFAMRGLRTMLVACRRVPDHEFRATVAAVREARRNLGGNRESMVSAACQALERGAHDEPADRPADQGQGLTLLGATAVEDRMQPGVRETLAALRAAGVHTWILTGDKLETAISVSYATGHFQMGTDLLFLTEQPSPLSVCRTLRALRERLSSGDSYGLVADGKSLAMALEHAPALFREVGLQCTAVVCCRLSPLQKCQVVRLIKAASKHPITAAIGDGANDVSMIQEAHVGLGIMGKEGRQAERCADFAMARFRFLQRALLVHGNWYYSRLSTLVMYFFYKNIVFVMPLFYFSLCSNFSTQPLYNSMLLTCYNIVFTSAPILVYGLLEQSRPAYQLLQHPHLYMQHQKNRLMASKHYIVWLCLGLWHSLTIFFVPVLAMQHCTLLLSDGSEVDIGCLGSLVYSSGVIVVSCKLLLQSHFWNVHLLLSVVFSLLLLLIINITYGVVNWKTGVDRQTYWLYLKLLGSPSFWLLTVLSLCIALLPDTTLLVLTNTRQAQKYPELAPAVQTICCCQHRKSTWSRRVRTQFNRQSGRISVLRTRSTVSASTPSRPSEMSFKSKTVTEILDRCKRMSDLSVQIRSEASAKQKRISDTSQQMESDASHKCERTSDASMQIASGILGEHKRTSSISARTSEVSTEETSRVE